MPEISCIIMFHRSSNNIFKDTDYYYCSFELYIFITYVCWKYNQRLVILHHHILPICEIPVSLCRMSPLLLVLDALNAAIFFLRN